MSSISSATFAPMLYLENVGAGIEFYTKAFGAIELRRFNNENGNVHVVEMTIGNSLFRLHEEVSRDREFSPQKLRGTTTIIGLLVENPDEVFNSAVSAGGIQLHGMQDHEYGYRQGTIADPFGHHWEIEKAPLVKSLFPQVNV
ncbi:MAG: VOC family protein [Chitinophagaceae bacterium]|nr:VOC family protein [Chitinophagaceae bacterium]